MFAVILSARAEADIVASYRYLRTLEPSQAQVWLNRLLAQIKTLSHFTERCGVVAESSRSSVEIREFLVGKKRNTFRVLFFIRSSVVNVIFVRRASRGPIPDDELP